jgi:adenylate cyclase
MDDGRMSSGPGSASELHHMQLLLDVSRQVAALDSLDAVLDALVAVAAEQSAAERATLYLKDPETGELYSRIAQGLGRRKIRLAENEGLAGAVFSSGHAEIIADAYGDDRFSARFDNETGFRTRNIVTAPIRTPKGTIIGVIQVLNKRQGEFTQQDRETIESITAQCAITLESLQLIERMEKSRARESAFMNVVSDITSELELPKLLSKVMSEATRLLTAERSTLFLNDSKKNELFSFVGGGLDQQIRLPNSAGIAGAVFTSGQSINIPYAYADLRFNPSFDRQTGFFTRSILCVPVVSKSGETIGVTQVLNKIGGPFTDDDERRLRAFTAQISIGLENAKLFDDVQAMRNYNDAMLQSMSNGVMTFDPDGAVRTCNASGGAIFRLDPEAIIGKQIGDIFGEDNPWLVERTLRVAETSEVEVALDAAVVVDGEAVSVNVTVLPLSAGDGKPLGVMVMAEDISNEKRVKSTLSRYMDPDIADQLLSGKDGEAALGGQQSVATVLFSDIRGFTTISERLGASGTVAMLNDYFEHMVECISGQGGMLDKFIGDAIMAVFGVPLPHDDDPDRGMKAAIGMQKALQHWSPVGPDGLAFPINIGVGLNTDTVVAGNIGSKKRMDYTIIGDGVNLAARLESACKQYGAGILLSEFTLENLRGSYRLRALDHVVVKGKTEPVTIYECLDHFDQNKFPNLQEMLGLFADGLRRYRARDFAKGKERFRDALGAHPGDTPSQMYLDRCDLLINEPPPEDWDGVWIMAEK